MNGFSPSEGSSRRLAARALDVPPFVIWLIVAVVLLLMSVPRLRAQDPLMTARSLYTSAAYDEALRTLQQLSSGDRSLPPTAIREVEEYRFLCLLALGRTAEARTSIGAVVTADPLYTLDENNTSPRVVHAFRDVRRELLPEIVQRIYDVAKAAYDKKDYRTAEPLFRKVVALAGDPDLQGKATDLGLLANGFLDLAVAANNPVPPPSNASASLAGASAAPPPAPVKATPTSIRAGAIAPPVTLKQILPPVPQDIARFGTVRGGELEILIDENGKVEQALFTKPIHPAYDGLVLQAAKTWRYEPAKADGVPVKFRKTIKVTFGDSSRDQQ